MSKHKYRDKYELPTSEEEVVEAVEVEEAAVETAEPEEEGFCEACQININTEPEQVKPKNGRGIVSGCEKLNIRRQAAVTPTNVICVIDKGSEVVILDEHAAPNWYKVCTNAGIEGYCMAEFIELT